MFITKANRSSKSMARLKQLLILLCRILGILALIIALSRPLVSGWLGWTFSGPPDTVIILLDRSASMGTEYSSRKTRHEQALKLIKSAAKPLGNKTRYVFIENVGLTPQVLKSSEILNELPGSKLSDTGADISLMFKAALDYLLNNKTGVTEVWVASDLQHSNWVPRRHIWKELESGYKSLKQPIKVRVLALDSKVKLNRSVTLIGSKNYKNNTHEIIFEVQKSDNKESNIPIAFFDGKNIHKIKIKLTGSITRYRHRFTSESKKGNGWGFIEIPSDSNTKDNKIYFCYGKPVKKTAIIIADKNSSSGLILKSASAPIVDEFHSAKIVPPSKFHTVNLSDTSMVIWAAGIPEKNTQTFIKNYINSGGAMFIFPGRKSSNQKWLDSISWGSAENAIKEKVFKVTEWEKKEGIFANSNSGDELSIDKLKIFKRKELRGKLNPIAFYADGKVFISRMKFGKGTVYFATTLPEKQWSNIGFYGSVLIPALDRLMVKGSKNQKKHSSEICGLWMMDNESNKVIKNIDSGPEKPKRHQSDAGVYHSENKYIAVNRPALEDLPGAIDDTEFKSIFTEIKLYKFNDKSGENSNMQSELWRAFIILMLALMSVEAFLCLPGKLYKKDTKQ